MPSYKLTYFDLPGKAETCRMLFSYGNIPFVDNRIQREDWPTLKPTTPWGQLPVLEIDGEQFGQSNAINKYLAQLVGLSGKDDKENMKIDGVVYVFDDLGQLFRPLYFEQDEEKKKELNKKFRETLPTYLEKLEERAKKNGGFLGSNRLSWADIMFINVYETLVNLWGGDVLDSYPNLQQVKKNVLSQEGIKNWIKNRPVGMKPAKYNLKQEV